MAPAPENPLCQHHSWRCQDMCSASVALVPMGIHKLTSSGILHSLFFGSVLSNSSTPLETSCVLMMGAYLPGWTPPRGRGRTEAVPSSHC